MLLTKDDHFTLTLTRDDIRLLKYSLETSITTYNDFPEEREKAIQLTEWYYFICRISGEKSCLAPLEKAEDHRLDGSDVLIREVD